MKDFEERREKLLELADRRFAEQGLQKTHMSALAAECGMSKKTLYRFFSSKNELVYFLLHRRMDALEASFLPLASHPGSVIERLREYMRLSLEALKDVHPELLQEMQEYFPEVWKEFHRRHDKIMFDSFRELFEEGEKSGLFGSTIDADMAFEFYNALVLGAVEPKTLQAGKYAPAELCQAAHTIFLNGVRSV